MRRKKPGPPFANFAIRVGALFLDFVVVIFLATALKDHVLVPAGFPIGDNRPVGLIVFLVYFSVAWSSPLRATAGQLLTDIRVVSISTDSLSPGRAILRSAALTGLIAGAFLILEKPPNSLLLSIAMIAYALIFLAAVTPNRQAAHDWLARSIVVSRRTLKRPEQRERLLAHLADDDPATLKDRRPGVWRMIGDAVGLVLPVFVMINVAQMQFDRELIYRTTYAYWKISDLKHAIASYHVEHDEWPSSDIELDTPSRASYPDGGFYERESNGVIRIHFTVIPDLMKGTIVVTPSVTDGNYTWTCHSEGEIARNHLPGMCRD
jgi:uncharacterized RDD family membrane protein YckC